MEEELIPYILNIQLMGAYGNILNLWEKHFSN